MYVHVCVCVCVGVCVISVHVCVSVCMCLSMHVSVRVCVCVCVCVAGWVAGCMHIIIYVYIIDHSYIALFSARKQTHCTHIACDSQWVMILLLCTSLQNTLIWRMCFPWNNMSQPLSDLVFSTSDLWVKSIHTSPTKLQAALLSVWFCKSLTTAIAFCSDCPKSRLNVYRQCKMLLQELSWNAKKLITSLPFLDSFIGFPSRNGSATKKILPLTSLISKNTTLLAFSDQHLDLSSMFLGPGVPRQSGTVSEPSDISLPPSGMTSLIASRRTPFSLSDLYLGMIVNVIVYVRLRWCVC